MEKLSEKKKLTFLRKKEKWERRGKTLFSARNKCDNACIVGGTGVLLLGGFGYSAVTYEIAKREFDERLSEAKEQINDTFLQIAQEKANAFNEKFGETIPVPTSGDVSVKMDGYGGIAKIDSTAIDSVRDSITNIIDDKVLIVKTGETHGHISGFSSGSIYGSSGDLLVKDGYQDFVIDGTKFLRNEFGDALNNQLIDITQSIVPAPDLLQIGFAGFGFGGIPGAILCAFPVALWLGQKVAERKAKEYMKEYTAMCATDGKESANIKDEMSL